MDGHVSSNRILIFSPKILNVARSHGNETKQLCRLHKMADNTCSSPYLDFASISLLESANVTRWCVHDKNSLDKLNVPLIPGIRKYLCCTIKNNYFDNFAVLDRRNFATNSRKYNDIEVYIFIFPRFFHGAWYVLASIWQRIGAESEWGEERSDNFETTRFIY